MTIDKIFLAPYYWSLRLRHSLYDKGIKKSSASPVPTIAIGNITVGGTGKTPHTEMIVRLLTGHPDWKDKHIAVLSRGYKRKTKGFMIVHADGKAEDFGDEPLQIKRKFPEITVAVDKDRNNGCKLLSKPYTDDKGNVIPGADVIILDDAFQYRALIPSLSIVLIDYNKPIFNDHLIPIGNLRDIPERIHKADMVIVTKCPAYIDDEEKKSWAKRLDCPVFFTTIEYDDLQPVFPEKDSRYTHAPRMILFSGIADDGPLSAYLSGNYKVVEHFRFGDHHSFSQNDIRKISNASEQYPNAVVATTEKDSQRLLSPKTDVPQNIKQKLFYIPIKAQFILPEEQDSFMQLLGRYI